MIFETDNQTLTDLNLLGKYKHNSIYSLFCDTVTTGGELLLEHMFQEPLTDAKQIKERIVIFKWFKDNYRAFPLTAEQNESAENYLSTTNYRQLVRLIKLVKLKGLEIIGKDPQLEFWKEQLTDTIGFIVQVKKYLLELDRSIFTTPIGKDVKQAIEMLNNPDFEPICNQAQAPISEVKLIQFDKIILATHNKGLLELLELLNLIDVATQVGRVANERNMTFPEVNDAKESVIEINDMRHPVLRKAIANNLCITQKNNMFFLTGANMAGKSTFMKSFGCAIYMAHMGFPVAASSMRFTVQQGLYSSINISDDLVMGYSHFYVDVLRVKNIAIEVSLNKRLVLIFDELFKGTNVKDAYDATLAVTEALASRENCMLMISTHIIEVGTELKSRCNNIIYKYLPTVMSGSIPKYTYKLAEGITDDRHGMLIINNERVIEIILGDKNK